ncbi:MAG: OmpA family protein, partial [bacterium]|nr:OmpA family protein [bacterium]
YKCEHKTCKNGEVISNPASNSSPSPLIPGSQMQLPDVLIQEQGSTPLPPLSRQSILDALQQAPSNLGQDTVVPRSTAADSFERFMLEAGLAPGGFVPGTGNLDAGTPLSQTPNAGDAARLQGGIISDIPATRVQTSQEERGAGGSNTFAPTQVAQFSAERPVTWEDSVSTFLGCTVGYFFGGCDSAVAQTEKTDAQVIAETGGRTQPDITIVAVTPNVNAGKDTQLSEGEIQSRIAKDLTPDYDKLPPASQAIATKNAIDQYNRLTPESQATMRSMAIQGIQFDRAMAQSKSAAAQSQSPAAPPLPSPLDAAVAVGKSVAVTTAKSVWDWGTGSVRNWFGSADTSVAPTEGEQPNPPAAVQAPPEPGAPAAVTPSLADIDIKTPAQLKEIEARLSADKSAQAAEDEARRMAAIPKSPQTLQNNIFAGLYKAIGGSGTEDLKTAWNEAALARSNPEPVPVTPVEVAELAPIAGTELRTASAPAQALPESEPELEVPQLAAPVQTFTVDPKIDAQVREAFETQKQSAQSQIRYFEELLARSGTTVSEAAAQGGLNLSKARLDAIAAEEKLYNDRSPSPALRAAIEQLQSGGGEGAWARSFTSFADSAHKLGAQTGKEMQTSYTNPAEVIGGLADGAIVLGSGFAGGVTEGLRNFATKAGVPGFEDDPNRALVNAIDPYKKYTQTAVDAANVVPFSYGIYSAGKMGFGAVADMMTPAGIVVRDLGVIGELSPAGVRVAGSDLIEGTAGAGTRVGAGDVPLSATVPSELGGAVTETSVPRFPSAANIEPVGDALTPTPASPFDKVTQFVKDAVENPAEMPTPGPRLPSAANIEPAGTPSAPGPYAALDDAVADARAAAEQPAGPSGASSAVEAPPAVTASTEDAVQSSLPTEFSAGAKALEPEVDKLSLKDWTGGTGVIAGILCMGFCPSSEPLPQEPVPAEIVPLSKEDLALLFPQENKVQQPSAPSEVPVPVNIEIDETPALAQPSAALPVEREAPAPTEQSAVSPLPPAVVPPVLTAPPLPVEADIVLPPAPAEDAEAQVLANIEMQRKKNEEALAAWDEAQRQRTKEIQDKIARLEKEVADMNLPSPVIVPQDISQDSSPGAQGVGPLTSDEIARGLLPNPTSEGSKRKDLEINFELGSATLQKDGREQVAALAEVMSRDEFRNSTFTIVGHTDTVGTAESNLILSRQRAQAIVDTLNRDYGIPLDQMKVSGAGQWALKVPILGNVAANRRVEIVVTPRR